MEPFAAVADRLNSYNHFLGHPDFLNRDLRRFSEVTAPRVRRFVAQQLRKDRRVVVHAVPGEKILLPEPPASTPPAAAPETKAESSEPWRNEVPGPGPAPPAKLPVPRRFELQNGLPVYLVESHSLPIVSAQLTSRSGSGTDPVGLSGLSGFSTSMLNEGAGKRGAIEIANDLAALGSTLDTGLSKEGSWINIQALKDQFPETVAIMKDVALSPTFPEKEIERVRNDRLVALQQQRDRPMTTAFKVMWRELYGPEHPYGHQTLGSRQAIRKISQHDLKTAYERSFRPQNSALILAGDLTLAEAKRIASDAFGKWERPGRRSQALQRSKPAEERVVIVDKPGSPQTALVLAQLGVARSHPDFEKLEVTNEILGGLFASRLNLNLRETKGYTYGVVSEVSANRWIGPIHISTSVETQFTGAAVREVLNEVSRLRESGVSDDELHAARDSILHSLPALFGTNASTARAIAHLYVLGLPRDHYERLGPRLESITKDEVGDAARKHLDPDKMKIIAVGDGQTIESQLAELGLGKIGYRTAEGLPEGSQR
jgi:zinc protease